MVEYIELKCIKEGSKLRIRIITRGYYNHANCQFPRDLREDGLRYKVKADAVKLITTRGKWFYSIKKKEDIEIIRNNENEIINTNSLKDIKIFEDEKETCCAICMTLDKEVVFYPCGHYHTCTNCSNLVKNCPMCMKPIEMRINRKLIE